MAAPSGYGDAMRGSRLIVSGALALVGAIWFGQGIGVVGGSFMTGQPFWAVVGLVCVAAAALVLAQGRRRPGG
jgi:hypothetical protein